MGWATPYIDKLKKGETVQFRPRGNSMSGRIESGQLCTVEFTASAFAWNDCPLYAAALSPTLREHRLTSR
jgi:hypothetical protein